MADDGGVGHEEQRLGDEGPQCRERQVDDAAIDGIVLVVTHEVVVHEARSIAPRTVRLSSILMRRR